MLSDVVFLQMMQQKVEDTVSWHSFAILHQDKDFGGDREPSVWKH